ncbi:hypothetical protein L209DRAFT_225491 [Thermothelomyces heterothallicus CBS 203.75]
MCRTTRNGVSTAWSLCSSGSLVKPARYIDESDQLRHLSALPERPSRQITGIFGSRSSTATLANRGFPCPSPRRPATRSRSQDQAEADPWKSHQFSKPLRRLGSSLPLSKCGLAGRAPASLPPGSKPTAAAGWLAGWLVSLDSAGRHPAIARLTYCLPRCAPGVILTHEADLPG